MARDATVYRFQIDIKVAIGRSRGGASTRETFWSQYRRELLPSAGEDGDHSYTWFEQRVRTTFPTQLQHHLRKHIPDVSIIFSDLRYGSLEATLTAVSTGFAALGLGTEDAARLIRQYVPVAFTEALPPVATELDFETRVASRTDERETAPKRMPGTGGFAWIVANTSLLLPSVVLAVAAFLLFRAAEDKQHDILSGVLAERKTDAEALAAERAQLTDALIKARAEIADERKARFAADQARVKTLEAQISEMNAKWLQVLQEYAKARARSAAETRPTRRK